MNIKSTKSGSLLIPLVFVLLGLLIVGAFLFVKNKNDSSITTQKTTNNQTSSNTENVSRTELTDLYFLQDNDGYTLAQTDIEPCEQKSTSTPNLKEIEPGFVIDDSSIYVCESYLTSNQSCFSSTDKTEQNPQPCSDTGNGPYNMVYVYRKSSNGKFEYGYLVVNNKSLPEQYQDTEARWTVLGKRYADSIPDLESRQISNSNFYTYSENDPCTLGSPCNQTPSKTLYYRVDNNTVFELRSFTETELQSRGG